MEEREIEERDRGRREEQDREGESEEDRENDTEREREFREKAYRRICLSTLCRSQGPFGQLRGETGIWLRVHRECLVYIRTANVCLLYHHMLVFDPIHFK